MNEKSLYKLSCGLYIISSSYEFITGTTQHYLE